MRKILLPLLFCIGMTAQTKEKDNYMAGSFGSDINGHLIGQFSMVSKNVEVNLGYDNHLQLDYSRYSLGLGYHFPLYTYVTGNEIKTTFIPSIEPSLINRTGNWGGGLGDTEQKSSHLSLGLNLALQWDITESISVQYSLNLLPRTDLSTMYPKELWSEQLQLSDMPVSATSFVKVVFKINR